MSRPPVVTDRKKPSPRPESDDEPAEVSELAELRAQLAAVERTHAMVEFAPDGTILHANDNFLRALGYTLEEVRGQHHAMFVDPATRASANTARSGATSPPAVTRTASSSASRRVAATSGCRARTTRSSTRAGARRRS